MVQVFVELEELRSDGVSEDVEWEETARWIKFEEDLEEGSGRWGRPHVSALTFHSLVQLRQGLEKGGRGMYANSKLCSDKYNFKMTGSIYCTVYKCLQFLRFAPKPQIFVCG